VEFCWAKAAAERTNNAAKARDARTREFPPFKPRKFMQPSYPSIIFDAKIAKVDPSLV
jgi:hypothetical protein